MGAAVHCESVLPRCYSMRDLSEESNSCSWSVHCGDKYLPALHHQNGSLSARSVSDSHSGYQRDFVKRTMLEHEFIFKNQVSELHRLYRVQRSLMEELRKKKLFENLNQSEGTPGNGSIKPQMPGFLLGNLECGGPSILGNSSQACSVPMQNGVSSKDREVLEVRPVKVSRKMIDLQLPAEAYMDTDETVDPPDNMRCPYEQSKSGKEVCGIQIHGRGNASHQEDSSGSCLGLKKFNGFADLNEPVHCQESEEPVASSKDVYSFYGRNNVHVQGQCLEKNTCQNGRMVLEAGHEKSNPTDKLRLPFHSAQVFSNNAFQPPGYPSSDHGMAKLSGERTNCELETRLRNPEILYDSYVESSVASSVPSSHGHHPEFAQPCTNWLSPWENPSSSSGQKLLSVQASPFLNCNNTQGRANPSFEIRRRDFNGLYQGSSSGPKEAVFGLLPVNSNHFNSGSNGAISNCHFSAAGKLQGPESLQGPKKREECSTGLSWLKSKPPYRSEITNGCFDLNASINQFTEEPDMGNGFSNASPHKSLRSVACSNNAGLGRVEKNDFQDSRKILGFPVFEKYSVVKEEPSSLTSPSVCITGRPVEETKRVKRNLDINLPCDAAVSSIDDCGVEIVAFVDKEETIRAAGFRRHIDLNLCASEDEDSAVPSSLRVKRKATPWIDLEAPAALEIEEETEKSPEKTNEEDTRGLRESEDRNFMDELIKAAAEAIVTISFSEHQCHPDEAASSSSDGPAKDPLTWFVDTIVSCGYDLGKQIDASSEGRHCEGGREECSSGKFDYFEAMTLNLPETKEEDYMPKPLVLENLKFDGTESTTAIPNRPRRGQPRRGRPRRDFQRDILPGLTSLARHEVTEDLQVFGGLMKATGCSWSSGMARRNPSRGGGGSKRGRKRLVTNIDRAPSCPSLTTQQQQQQPTNEDIQVAAGLEERSLTGWGQATRRPRRQRCPAGNPPTVILT